MNKRNKLVLGLALVAWPIVLLLLNFIHLFEYHPVGQYDPLTGILAVLRLGSLVLGSFIVIYSITPPQWSKITKVLVVILGGTFLSAVVLLGFQYLSLGLWAAA